ncbi:MAG TPA: hypothetical protein V6D15_05085 [Oculatellaceae cyanobacterium]|jgi:hypothetical protein
MFQFNNISKTAITITACFTSLLATSNSTWAYPNENLIHVHQCLVGKVVNARFMKGIVSDNGKFEPLLNSKKS